jgi:hypothetical protein
MMMTYPYWVQWYKLYKYRDAIERVIDMIGKYSRIKYCSNEHELIVKNAKPNPCCTDSRVRYDYEPMLESTRVRKSLCVGYIRPGPSSSDCRGVGGNGDGDGSGGGSGGGPVNLMGSTQNPGQNPIQVRTRPASETTALVGAITLNAASNASNPDTRFSQYFPEIPPAPIGIICPERIPNPAPPTRDRFCVPQTLFAPSVPGGPIA